MFDTPIFSAGRGRDRIEAASALSASGSHDCQTSDDGGGACGLGSGSNLANISITLSAKLVSPAFIDGFGIGAACDDDDAWSGGGAGWPGSFKFTSFFQSIPKPVDCFSLEACHDPGPGGAGSFGFTKFLRLFFQSIPRPVDGFSLEACDDGGADGGGSFTFTRFLRLFFQLIPKPVDGFSLEACDDAGPDGGGSFKVTKFLKVFFQFVPKPVDVFSFEACDAGPDSGVSFKFTIFLRLFFQLDIVDDAGFGSGEFNAFVQWIQSKLSVDGFGSEGFCIAGFWGGGFNSFAHWSKSKPEYGSRFGFSWGV